MQRLRRSPALTLFLIAPLAELITASVPPLAYFYPLTLVLAPLLYGSGALLVREAVVRWGKGWPSLLLLGAAYGVYEEGITARSFFDPSWVDLDTLGVYGRALGVNWVWAAHLTQFHALISMAASVIIAELLHPSRSGQPWLSRAQIRLCAVALLSWTALGFLINPYIPPLLGYALTWALIGALIWAARHVPARPFPPRTRPVPRPRRFWALGLGGMTAYVVLVYTVSEHNALPPAALIALLVALDALVLWLALRWSGNGAAWDDRHKLAFVAGALWLFVPFGFILEAGGVFGMSGVSVALAVGLETLARRTKRRVAANTPLPTEIAPPHPTA